MQTASALLVRNRLLIIRDCFCISDHRMGFFDVPQNLAASCLSFTNTEYINYYNLRFFKFKNPEIDRNFID